MGLYYIIYYLVYLLLGVVTKGSWAFFYKDQEIDSLGAGYWAFSPDWRPWDEQ